VAEISYPWDDRGLTEAEWRTMGRLWYPSGIVRGALDGLACFADSSGMQVKVRAGRAWARGHLYTNDAELTWPVAGNSSGSTRVDRVVVRFDFAANTAYLHVIEGEPGAGSPEPVSTATVFDITVANVTVVSGAVTIAAGDVVDLRRHAVGTDHITTVESTTATTYTDLATVGPTTFAEVGESGILDVTLSCRLQNDTAGAAARMSFEVSTFGGTVLVAPNDGRAVQVPGTAQFRVSNRLLVDGLSPGGVQVRAKYNVSAGAGTFADRRLIVEPL
jgi:hypothetical protein